MLLFPAPVMFGKAGSSILTKVGAFNTGTGAVSSTVAVTGVGFQPKAIIFWWSGLTGTSNTISGVDIKAGIGFASLATERGAACVFIKDGAGTSDTSQLINNDACIIIPSAVSTIDGKLDLQSMDSDGFTLVVDNQFGSDYRVHYMALGGDAEIEAQVDDFTIAASTGNQDFTVGFTPDLVMIFTTAMSSFADTLGNWATLNFGAFNNSNQFLYCGRSVDGSANANAKSYLRMDDEAWGFANTTGTGIDRRAVGSIITNGFRLNVIEAPSADVVGIYLAIKGGNCHIGSTTTATNTTPFSVTGVGFEPTGIFCISHNKTESTAETLQGDLELSIGAASSTSDQQTSSIRDVDTAATMIGIIGFAGGQSYLNLGAGVAEGRMVLDSFDSGGMTLHMSDADPSAALVAYIAFG